MAILTANSAGQISGKFTIPAGIPVGAKRLTAIGAGGSAGFASFTGRGTVTTEERRIINTVNVQETLLLTPFVRRVDPLAQTFTLGEGRAIAGIDLWFTAKGTKDVLVQIRRTSSGVPNADILSEKRVPAASITVTGGAATAITFDQLVWLEAGIEYAIVIMTDDAVTAVSVAELGKYDATAQRWITSQPFQVGVLLSSSNASTWTAHQDRDLTFRLKAARFTATTRSVPLGTVAVTNMSDMMPMYNVDIPATGASAELKATAPDGTVYRLSENQALSLPALITGTMTLSMELTGTATASPVLYPNIQFVAGTIGAAGTYITRQFPVGSAGRISVAFEALTPGTSTITVEYQLADLSWVAIALTSGTSIGDGWVERSHIVTGITLTNTRIRVTVNGTTVNRPRIRKLRAIATA